MGSAESPLAAEARLVGERATAEWLRGDVIHALVAAAELDREVYRVRGLDENGHPTGAGERAFGALFAAESAGEYVAVRGDRPDCAAVGLYRVLEGEHTWLVLTSHRLAVLRLRDLARGTESDEALERAKEEKSLGGALRGLGKFVKASASEFAKSVRRPPLAERPGRRGAGAGVRGARVRPSPGWSGGSSRWCRSSVAARAGCRSTSRTARGPVCRPTKRARPR